MPTFDRVPRPEKIEAVEELSQILKSSAIILTDYQALDVKAMMAFRRKLHESNGGCKIVKNTLLRRAAKDTAAERLAEETVGPTAIVYSDDPVAAAKTLQDYLKGAKALKVKAGVVDGHVYAAAQIEALSKIPPKEMLYAMVVGGLQSPITGLCGTLQQLISQLVFTLQGVADKKTA